MDFVDGFPRSRKGIVGIWVIVDRLTKSTQFTPIMSNRTTASLAQLYVREVVRLRGVSTSIVSDMDPLFTSKFWRNLQATLGTKLNLIIAYYPQINGPTERVNRILKNLLRAIILDFGGSCEQRLPLVEFTYNNKYQTSIGMALYEALYGRQCKSPNCLWESTDKILLDQK